MDLTVEEMAGQLADRQTHCDRHSKYLAWDIKIHDFDARGYVDGYKPNPEWDERWEGWSGRTDHSLFFDACADGLRIFFDDDGRNFFDGFAEGHPLYRAITAAEFTVFGRSGGWLGLNKLNDQKIDATVDWISLAEEDPDWVRLVYYACLEIDKFDPTMEIELQYAFRRSEKEEVWDEAERWRQQRQMDFKLLGTFIYLRAHPIDNKAVIEAAKRLNLPVTPDGKVESDDGCNDSSG